MPFPLAHPAAILPFRKLCPRRLSFPALIIGCLCPDVGYCFGRLHVDQFSHRFFAGSLGFCLPVGLLLLFVFYRLRHPVIRLFPPRYRRIFEPLCSRPAGSISVIVLSLLIGSWTHLFLDSITHRNGWLVTHLSLLQASVGGGYFRIPIFDLLYDLSTFVGAAWLALAYLNWLERAAGMWTWIFPGFKWCAVLVFAASALLLSFANHNLSLLGVAGVAMPTVALAAIFLLATVWALRDGPKRKPESPGQRETESVLAQIPENHSA